MERTRGQLINLLCWLGWHRWLDEAYMDEHRIYYSKVCKRCHKTVRSTFTRVSDLTKDDYE